MKGEAVLLSTSKPQLSTMHKKSINESDIRPGFDEKTTSNPSLTLSSCKLSTGAPACQATLAILSPWLFTLLLKLSPLQSSRVLPGLKVAGHITALQHSGFSSGDKCTVSQELGKGEKGLFCQSSLSVLLDFSISLTLCPG